MKQGVMAVIAMASAACAAPEAPVDTSTHPCTAARDWHRSISYRRPNSSAPRW